MISESGTVVAVEADGLWVETLKSSACASCSAKAGCGNSLLAKSVMKDLTIIKALFSEQTKTYSWQVGDRVMLSIDERVLVYATALAYLFPILSMLLFAIVIDYIYPFHASWTAAAGLLGLVFGGCVVRWRSLAKSGVTKEFFPTVTSKLT